MNKIALYNIILACFVTLGLVSCAGSIQQFDPAGASKDPKTGTPKDISGSVLSKCIDKFNKTENITYPNGKIATYSAGGIFIVTRYYPRDPETYPQIASLVSYKIALGKRWADPDYAYAFCYYKNVNGKLTYLNSLTTNGYGDMNSIYVNSISSNIYYDLTGKIIRVGM